MGIIEDCVVIIYLCDTIRYNVPYHVAGFHDGDFPLFFGEWRMRVIEFLDADMDFLG